jgi:GNAT superfamily N-acetyltransferase
MPMSSSEKFNHFFVLKIPVERYRESPRTMEEGFWVAGSEVKPKIQKAEKRLLKSLYRNWKLPYFGKIIGWREDSPIYILYNGQLAGAVYVCDQNQFGEDNWGELHYAFMEPSFKNKGLYSIMFREAVFKTRRWGLKGMILTIIENPTEANLTPKLVIDAYLRWGAVPWKTVKRPKPPPLTFSRKVIRLLKKPLLLVKKLILSS